MAGQAGKDPCLEHFHPHRDGLRSELLAKLAASGGERWDGSAIRVRSGPFSIVIDVHAEVAGFSSRVVTRLRAPYVNRDGFRFRIRKRSLVLDLATHFGMQDIEVDDEEFDREFIIQANSEQEVRQLFGDANLRADLLASPMELMEVRDDEGWFGPDFPGEVDELYMQAAGRITDPEAVDRLYVSFAEVLDRLCQIGSAYRSDPNLEL